MKARAVAAGVGLAIFVALACGVGAAQWDQYRTQLRQDETFDQQTADLPYAFERPDGWSIGERVLDEQRAPQPSPRLTAMFGWQGRSLGRWCDSDSGYDGKTSYRYCTYPRRAPREAVVILGVLADRSAALGQSDTELVSHVTDRFLRKFDVHVAENQRILRIGGLRAVSFDTPLGAADLPGGRYYVIVGPDLVVSVYCQYWDLTPRWKEFRRGCDEIAQSVRLKR